MIEWTLCCGRCSRTIVSRGATDAAVKADIEHRITSLGWARVAGSPVCAGCATIRDHLIAEIVLLAEACNEDELAVQLDIARRIDKGRAPYGPMNLDDDPRDLERKEDEEHLDSTIYRSMRRVRERRRAMNQRTATEEGSDA